jgi:hypothetical protein
MAGATNTGSGMCDALRDWQPNHYEFGNQEMRETASVELAIDQAVTG